jgi:hypothetical protein
MGMSWFQVIKCVPDVSAALKVVHSKEWYKSDSIIYQLIKTGVTLASALGLYFVLPEKDIQTISVGLSVAIPAVLTVFDGLVAVYLRIRTKAPIAGTEAAAEVKVAVQTLRDEIPSGVPGQGE